ncbi:hypothetical protein G7054_g15169 [Neopestalotiopsis clavispora]|nr:hypothetical protein G7054_g15169 [Neopestalotiopsis clavispora]
MVSIFGDDPVYNWFLYSTPETKRLRHLQVLIEGIIKAAAIADGVFTEINAWGASAVLIPPGCKPDSPLTVLRAGLVPAAIRLGPQPLKRLVHDYTSAAEKTKARGMTVRERKAGYHFLIFMGTSLDHRRQGLAGKLLQDMQARIQAGKQPRPIWLEATTAASRDLYAKHGFEIVEEINLGKGDVNAKGRAEPGGEGVTIWGMVWRPLEEPI